MVYQLEECYGLDWIKVFCVASCSSKKTTRKCGMNGIDVRGGLYVAADVLKNNILLFLYHDSYLVKRLSFKTKRKQ